MPLSSANRTSALAPDAASDPAKPAETSGRYGDDHDDDGVGRWSRETPTPPFALANHILLRLTCASSSATTTHVTTHASAEIFIGARAGTAAAAALVKHGSKIGRNRVDNFVAEGEAVFRRGGKGRHHRHVWPMPRAWEIGFLVAR